MVQKRKSKRRRPSDCRLSKDGNCSGKYQLVYDDDCPVFICDSCGDKDETWKNFYQQYVDIYKDTENWKVKKHTITCILGYFLHKYKTYYGTDYALVPNNPNPYSSKEVKDIWKLVATLGSASNVGKYIQWFFKHKIKSSTNLTSIAYLNTPNIIREFKIKLEKSKHLTRSSTLPKSFILWCKENIPEVFDNYELSTMNDLGSILAFKNKFQDGAIDSIEAKLIHRAQEVKLIKENRLNVRNTNG